MSFSLARDRPAIRIVLDAGSRPLGEVARGLGHGLHGLEVAVRRDREARLAHVDAEARERLRDRDLLLASHRRARALLAVAQRRVEDDEALALGRRRRERARGPVRRSGAPRAARRVALSSEVATIAEIAESRPRDIAQLRGASSVWRWRRGSSPRAGGGPGALPALRAPLVARGAACPLRRRRRRAFRRRRARRRGAARARRRWRRADERNVLRAIPRARDGGRRGRRSARPGRPLGRLCPRCVDLKEGNLQAASDEVREVPPEAFVDCVEPILARAPALCVKIVDATDFDATRASRRRCARCCAAARSSSPSTRST